MHLKPWKTNPFEEIARRKRSAYKGCWDCEKYGAACYSCKYREHLRAVPTTTVPATYAEKIRYICKKANDDGTITAAASQCSAAERKALVSYHILTLEKETDKATTTIYRIDTKHPSVKLWWQRIRRQP